MSEDIVNHLHFARKTRVSWWWGYIEFKRNIPCLSRKKQCWEDLSIFCGDGQWKEEGLHAVLIASSRSENPHYELESEKKRIQSELYRNELWVSLQITMRIPTCISMESGSFSIVCEPLWQTQGRIKNRWQFDWFSISTHRVFHIAVFNTEELVANRISLIDDTHPNLYNGRKKKEDHMHTALHLDSSQSIPNTCMNEKVLFHSSGRINLTSNSFSFCPKHIRFKYHCNP